MRPDPLASFERWLPVAGFDAYEVSDTGLIWSRRTERVLRGTPIKGYMNVRLKKGAKSFLRPIHRLVCIAFHGECPPDKEMVGHLDGDPKNNRVANLAWITRSENALHSIAHGTFQGAAVLARYQIDPNRRPHPSTKLTAEQAEEIRRSPLPHTEVARNYGVCESVVRRIRNGRSWKPQSSLRLARFAASIRRMGAGQ